MFRPLLSLCLALATSGCAMGGTISRMSVDYNEAVARMFDEQTLLNILRAKERMPQHYTSVSALRGNVTVKANAGLELTLEQGPNTHTPSIGGSIENGSEVDVSVDDTQTFYQGITQSVDQNVVAHYLQQGWDPRMIAMLLIESIELTPAYGHSGVRPIVVRNTPSTREFTNFLNCYRLSYSPDGGGTRTIKVDAEKVGDVAFNDLLATDFSRTRNKLSSRKFDKKGLVEIEVPGKYPLEFILDRDSQNCIRSQRYAPFQERSDRLGATITIRSVDSALYFIGEYLRNLDIIGEEVEEAHRVKGEPLFVVRQGSSANAAISASLLGRRYYVPAELAERGRTTQVITLLQQLMNIHKVSSERPNTVPVRLQRF